MIYCYLKGGLGNMLFQIAATKSFSIDIKTDCSFPNLTNHLKFLNEDQTYNPKLNYAFEYESLLTKLNSTSPTKPLSTYNFPFHYVNPIMKDEIIIDGFFQSEKYFKHNRESILNFLNFEVISHLVKEKYNNIINNNSTSVHIRRGDYVRLPSHHPLQTKEYFNSSINLLKNKTDNFVIFSDDIDWCKKNIEIDNCIFIENEKDYIELYLMSQCKNNIISNSSFSWWGAWLNNKDDKVVIAPKIWFGQKITHKTEDIIPNSWTKL